MTHVVVARSVEEVKELRPAWETLPVNHPHADLDFYLAVIEEREEAIRPHAVVVYEEGIPVGLVAARLEKVTLPANFGYCAVYNPRVRALTLAPGGAVVTAASAAAESVRAILECLRANEFDVAVFPSLRRDSELFEAVSAAVAGYRRGHFADIRTHRRLHVPDTFDEFLASRSKKVRSGIRYDARRLEQRLGDRLHVERFGSTGDVNRIFADVIRVADLTYQKGLGASFSDSPERRRLTGIALEKGWFRAWVLYDDNKPIAFWQGSVYRGTYHSGTTGYDPAYGRDRVGIWLLMRVIEDLCNDPQVNVLDYGFGDADYKRHLSDEDWNESDLVVFAPTLRGLTVNAGRTAIMAGAAQAKAIVDRLGVTNRLRTRWRRRLRSGGE